MHRIQIAERPDWRAKAEQYGFRFHTIAGARYWDESAYYRFTLRQIEQDIEGPTEDLHEMAMALVDDVIDSEALLTRLCIPEKFWDWIRQSWRDRHPYLYGRMDLAYDGIGSAKLYELNYDTPTSIYEAAFFQWLWLEDQINAGNLPSRADQYNSLQELLIESFSDLAARKRLPAPLYFSAVRDSTEDQGTVEYLRDCAHQAGLDTRLIAIEDIGLSEDGRFTDLDDFVIPALFKLYPLEDLFREQFAAALPTSGMQLLEPPWKSILSNKGILPLLWERHTGHPNLLPAYAENSAHDPLPSGWIRKPVFSREGANIQMHLTDGTEMKTAGPYLHGPTIRQACHPLPCIEGNYPVIGSWTVGNRAAGLSIREDSSPITQDTSRFIPHIILD